MNILKTKVMNNVKCHKKNLNMFQRLLLIKKKAQLLRCGLNKNQYKTGKKKKLFCEGDTNNDYMEDFLDTQTVN